MAEYTLLKLLGGVGNGEDVPVFWAERVIAEYFRPGTDAKTIYEKRAYYEGDDKYYVWADTELAEPAYLAIVRWHREMYRGSLVEAQKDVLHESIQAGVNYTNIIMLVGYAALFTMWTQGEGKFTPATSFAVGICLAISVLIYIAWEIYGMVLRSTVNINIGKAVNNPEKFEEYMKSYRETIAKMTRRYYPYWVANVAGAAGFGLTAFIIMLSAMIHGAWLTFAHTICVS